MDNFRFHLTSSYLCQRTSGAYEDGNYYYLVQEDIMQQITDAAYIKDVLHHYQVYCGVDTPKKSKKRPNEALLR